MKTGTLLLAVVFGLFGIAAYLAYLGLTTQSTNRDLPIAVALLAGIVLVIQVLRLSGQSNAGGGRRQTASAATRSVKITSSSQWNYFLPALTIVFVALAVLATAAVSYPDQLLKLFRGW